MEDNKRKTIGSIVGLIIFIISILSLTYAFYRWRSTNSDVNVGIHDGGIKYVYSNNNILASNTLAPVVTYNNVSNSLLYTDYTATNITTSDSYKMTAILHVNSISSSLQTGSFKWVLLEGDGTTYTTAVKEGNFANVTTGDNTIDLNVYITPGTTKKYRFIMYIDGNMQNNPSSGSIDAELELCDQVVSIIPITLNNNGATTGQEGTASIYLRYGVGIYKDSGAATTKMSTTENPITSPGRDGYLFLGYYDQAQTNTNGTCTGTRLIDGVEKPTGVTDNINNGHITSAFTNTKYTTAKTLYACWKINNFTITLNDSEATTAGTASVGVTYNSTTLNPSTITVPKKEYAVSYNMNSTGITAPSNQTATWSLNGWYTATSSGDKVLSPGPNIALQASASNNGDDYTDANSKWIKTGNVTLYARWTGGTVTLPALSKTGYTCKWAKGSAAGTQYNPGSTSEQLSANTTYYAVCTGNSYKVKFVSANTTNCPLNTTTYADINTAYGTNVKDTAIANPTCTGYTFNGWTASGDFSGAEAKYGTSSTTVTTSWTNGSTPVKGTFFKNLSTTTDGTVTLTANWQESTDTHYTVNHYVHDLGTNTYTLNSTDNLTGTTNASLTLTNLKKTIAGFTYVDGYLTGNTTKPTSGAVTTTKISADGSRVINLYYRRNYLYIQYDMNGGSLSETHGTGIATSGTLITYNSSTKFLRGVYGSTVNSVNTTTYVTDTGGLHNWDNQNAINIVKTGYKAKTNEEWNTSADGTGTSYGHNVSTYDANGFAGADLSTGDKTVTVYLNWIANNYTVTYDSNLGQMDSWGKAYPDRYTTTYDSSTGLYSVAVDGASGWEHLYLPIDTVSGKSYKVTFDYQIPEAYTTLSGYDGIGYMATTNVNSNNNLSSLSLATEYLPKTAVTTTTSANLTFTATGTRTFFTLNFGMASDNKTTTIKIGNVVVTNTTDNTVVYAADPTTQSKTYQQPYGTLATAPTRTGYTFNGWYTAKSGGTKIETTTNYTITSNQTLYAHWTMGSYTQTYKANGGTGNDITETVGYWNIWIAKAANTYSKAGYSFVGWNTNSSATTAQYTANNRYYASANVGTTRNIYAIWAESTGTAYTVNHYVHDLGTNTYTLNSTDNLTGTTNASLTLANLKKTIAGFTYVDGYLTGNTTKPTSGAVTTTTILADGSRVINLYYRRNYLYIQYDMNGGSLSETHGTGIATSGTLITYNSSTKFLRGVYGSTVNSVNTTTYVTDTSGLHNWDNTNSINLIKTGYTAKANEEWNSRADGTGTSYGHNVSTYDANGFAGADLSTGDKTVTVYLNWIANNYTIAYNLNNGNNPNPKPTSGTYDTDVQIGNPTKTVTVTPNANGTSATVGSATSANQTFSGWTSTTVGTNAKTGSSANPTTSWTGSSTKNTYFKNLRESGTVTMIANWTAVNVTLPTLTNPTGQTCKYYTDATSGTEMGAGGASWNPGANSEASRTAYARCSNNTYSIVFNKNATDATGTMSNLSMTYGTAKNLTTNAYSRSGYTFIGWSTNTEGTGTLYTNGQSVNNLTATNNGTFNLYAIWRTNNYTVKFNGNSNNGGSTADETMTYGTAKALTANGFTKTGYSFSKWDDLGGNLYNNQANLTINPNMLYNTSAPTITGGYNGLAGNWRSASGGTGTRTAINISNGPSSLITKGFEIANTDSTSNKTTDISQDNIPVTIGNKYTISVYAKGTGTLNIEAGNSTYGNKTFTLSNVTTWTRYSWTFTAGTNGSATNNKTNIYFGNRGTGTLQIAGMKLEAGESVTPYIDTTHIYHLKATWTDSGKPSVTLTSTSSLKAASQTATLKCTDNNAVTAYYWGTTEPTAASNITTTTSADLTSLASSTGLSKTINAAGTYWLGCKDAAGNFDKKSVTIYKYTVNNMLQNISGTTYTTTHYTQASTNDYIAPSGTTLTLTSIYTIPTGSREGRWNGASVGAASTTAATPSKTNPTLSGTTTYSMWFTRNVVYFKYLLQSGEVLQSSSLQSGGTDVYTFTTNSSNNRIMISTNGGTATDNISSVRYGNTSLNLWDYNNVAGLNIVKNGYTAVNNAQYICTSGCKTANMTFKHSQYTDFNTSNVCSNIATEDCTVSIKVNWATKNYSLSYDLKDGSVATANPTSYNITSSNITLNNPTKTGNNFGGWTEQITGMSWYAGFINLSSGAIGYDANYTTSYYTDLIYLRSGETYTLSGYGSYNTSEIRWRVYNTDGTYSGNGANGITYTATSNCYVRILYYNGSTSEQRSGTIITRTSKKTSEVIYQGSTVNRKYTANWTGMSYTATYDYNLFTASSKTQNGVTITYDKDNQYLTLNGTDTSNSLSFGKITDMALAAGDNYRVTLTFVSGSYTSTAASNSFIFDYQKDGANYSDRTTAPKTTFSVALPTSGTKTSNLVLDSTRSDANGINFWFWHPADGTTTFTNYKIRVSVTKVDSKSVTYGSTYGTLTTPSKPGYTFDGWYTAVTGGTKITSSSTVTATSNHTLYAHWTPNNATITIKKDGSNYSASGMKIALSTSNSSNTNYYSTTVSSGATASFTSEGLASIVASKTYYIWIGKDSNHKTDMVYSGVTLTGAQAATATVNYYTLTIALSHTTVTVNGTSISNNGTVIVAGGATTVGSNYAHAIVATAATGYQFASGATIWTTTGTVTIGSATTASTTAKVGAASTITATATAKTFGITLNPKNSSLVNSGYYTAGTSQIYMKYGDGVYLNNGYTTKMSTTANGITVPTTTGFNFGGYCKTNTTTCSASDLMIDAAGRITSNYSSTQHTAATTWYGIWTRNFTCTPGTNVTYAGKSWYVLNGTSAATSDSGSTTCELIGNFASIVTGSRNAINNSGTIARAANETLNGSIDNSYLRDGSDANATMKNEQNAGLYNVFSSSNSYINSDFGTYGTKPSSIYWSGNETIYNGTNTNYSNYSQTDSLEIIQGYHYINDDSGVDSDHSQILEGYTLSSTPGSEETVLAAKGSLSIGNSSTSISYQTYTKTAATTTMLSNRWSPYSFLFWDGTDSAFGYSITKSCSSTNCHWGIPLVRVIIDRNLLDENVPDDALVRSYTHKFYSCGGNNYDEDHRVQIEMKTATTTNSYYVSNYYTNNLNQSFPTGQARSYEFAGRTTSTSSLSGNASKTGKNVRTYDFNAVPNDWGNGTTELLCYDGGTEENQWKKFNITDTSTNIHYRPHISVRMTGK